MDQTNGARATVENPLSSSSESESEEIDQLKQIPQVLSLGASANKAICRSDLNKKLHSLTEEEILEVFQVFRAMQDDSPMT